MQDNESFTAQKGTLRGIHFQQSPMAQAKIVRVTRGAVMDVALDLRKGSPTYLQWVSVELSAENKRQFYIPRDFGIGFVALTDDVNFCYKVDNLYSKECDRSIRFDDPAIGVEWGVSEPVLSDKDKNRTPARGQRLQLRLRKGVRRHDDFCDRRRRLYQAATSSPYAQ